jgi:ribosome-associated protein
MQMLEITPDVAIPEHELTFTASRSSGPGGQHVNKVSSRMTLKFDVASSPSLSDAQKQRILTRLATRVSQDGILRVASQQHRSQMANRDAAIARFVTLLQEALAPEPSRKPTRPSRLARERRLEEKRRRSSVKRQRADRPGPEN